jgi:hypothetical protein
MRREFKSTSRCNAVYLSAMSYFLNVGPESTFDSGFCFVFLRDYGN